MQINKTKTITRLLIISLIALISLTGCLEDPFYKPAHTVGKLLGADSSNILLDFPIGTIGGSAPYCLYFMPKQKLTRADIDKVTKSLSYTVTVQENLDNNISGPNSTCGVESIKNYAHRSKVRFNSYKLLRGEYLSANNVPRKLWKIKAWHLSETSSAIISIEQFEYTPTTAVIDLNGTQITQTLVIVAAY